MPCEMKPTIFLYKPCCLAWLWYLGPCLMKAEKMFWLERKGSQSLLGILGHLVIDWWVRSQESCCPGLNKRAPILQRARERWERQHGRLPSAWKKSHSLGKKADIWVKKATIFHPLSIKSDIREDTGERVERKGGSKTETWHAFPFCRTASPRFALVLIADLTTTNLRIAVLKKMLFVLFWKAHTILQRCCLIFVCFCLPAAAGIGGCHGGKKNQRNTKHRVHSRWSWVQAGSAGGSWMALLALVPPIRTVLVQLQLAYRHS